MILFGSVIAQLINEIIPAGALMIIMILSMVVSLIMNLITGIKRFRAESKQIRLEKQEKEQKFKIHAFQSSEKILLNWEQITEPEKVFMRLSFF